MLGRSLSHLESIEVPSSYSPYVYPLRLLATEAIDVKTRRAAQAAVKRGLEVLEEACSLCDSTRGDDLPDVLQQMAQTLWDASEVVPTQKLM